MPAPPLGGLGRDGDPLRLQQSCHPRGRRAPPFPAFPGIMRAKLPRNAEEYNQKVQIIGKLCVRAQFFVPKQRSHRMEPI